MTALRKMLGLLLICFFVLSLSVHAQDSKDEAPAEEVDAMDVSDSAGPEDATALEDSDMTLDEVEAMENEENEVPVSEEEAAPIRAKAEQLIKDEIASVGSFEADHPETGDLISLKFTSLDPQVVKVFDSEFLLHGNFTDDQGNTYGVDIYLDQFEDVYEIVDAIVESINGKSFNV